MDKLCYVLLQLHSYFFFFPNHPTDLAFLSTPHATASVYLTLALTLTSVCWPGGTPQSWATTESTSPGANASACLSPVLSTAMLTSASSTTPYRRWTAELGRECLSGQSSEAGNLLRSRPNEYDPPLMFPRSTLQRAGKTVVLATNQLYFVQSADLVVYMSGGRVAETGTFSQLMAAPNQFAAMMKEVQVEEEDLIAEGGHGGEVATVEGPAEAAKPENNSKVYYSAAVRYLPMCLRASSSNHLHQSVRYLCHLPCLADPFPPPPPSQAAPGARLTVDEQTAEGSISAAVIFKYIGAMGGMPWFLMLFLGYIGVEVLRVATTVWLSIWTGSSDAASQGGGKEGYTPMFYLVSR